jgi:hypothetical protein
MLFYMIAIMKFSQNKKQFKLKCSLSTCSSLKNPQVIARAENLMKNDDNKITRTMHKIYKHSLLLSLHNHLSC